MAPVSTTVLFFEPSAYRAGRLDHRVGAVRDHDADLRALRQRDDVARGRARHLEAVHHHQRLDRHVEAAPSAPQHLVDVRVCGSYWPVSSSYSLSNVPPVTRILIAIL